MTTFAAAFPNIPFPSVRNTKIKCIIINNTSFGSFNINIFNIKACVFDITNVKYYNCVRKIIYLNINSKLQIDSIYNAYIC